MENKLLKFYEDTKDVNVEPKVQVNNSTLKQIELLELQEEEQLEQEKVLEERDIKAEIQSKKVTKVKQFIYNQVTEEYFDEIFADEYAKLGKTKLDFKLKR